MLVLLDRSLVANLANNPSPLNPTAITIDLAAEAVRQGTHLLCGDVATFDALILRTDIFNERTRILLARARKKSQFRQSLVDSIKWHLKITCNVAAPLMQTTTSGITEVLIPPTTIASHASLLNRPRLISENNNDGYFFEALSKHYIEVSEEYKNLFSTVKLHFDLAQGGGNTTAKVYSTEKLNHDHFCLAVVDSDQMYPTGPFGSTAAAVVAVDAAPNARKWNARHLVLGVRTVENLFPRKDLLRAAAELGLALGETAVQIVETYSNRDEWVYLPLKKGVRCFDIKPANTPIGKFLRNLTSFTECPHPPLNICSSREKCSNTVIASLSDKLLAQICKRPIQLNLDIVMDAMLLPHIKNLCDEMISTFCGDAPSF